MSFSAGGHPRAHDSQSRFVDLTVGNVPVRSFGVPSMGPGAAIPYPVPRNQLAIIGQLEEPLGGLDAAECLDRAEPE